MKKMDEKKDIADQILEDSIMEEGRRLEKILGPVTYENPKEYDMDAGFQKLLQKRAKLKEELQAKEADITLNEESNDYIVNKNKDNVSKNEMENDSTKITKAGSRKQKRIYLNTLTKVAVVVLVAGLCVIGFSMQSEATKMWWMESFGWDIGDDGATQVDNDEDRDMAEVPAWEAASEIEQEVGIKAPKFQYLPSKCVYSDCTYDAVFKSAIMYYKLDEEYITVNMTLATNDYASGANFDGSEINEENVVTVYGMVVVRELKIAEDEKISVAAEWDYLDVHYEILGKIPRKELAKMVEHMVL